MQDQPITVSDVERWLKAASDRANSDWGETFRFGYLQGITTVMVEMDNEIRSKAKCTPGTT